MGREGERPVQESAHRLARRFFLRRTIWYALYPDLLKTHIHHSIAIQLAKLSGFSPLIVTASLRHEAFLKSLGATHVVDRNADLVSEVKKIVGDTPVEVVYNISASRTALDESWEIVAPGGTLISSMPPPPPPHLKEKYDNKYIANVYADFNLPEVKELGVSLYSSLTDLLKDGTLKVRTFHAVNKPSRKLITTFGTQPNRVEVLPNGLHGIPDALQRFPENKVSGVKLVAHPQETA